MLVTIFMVKNLVSFIYPNTVLFWMISLIDRSNNVNFSYMLVVSTLWTHNTSKELCWSWGNGGRIDAGGDGGGVCGMVERAWSWYL